MAQYQQQNLTVLSMSIKGGAVDLETSNAHTATFGYPTAVCTNLADAAASDIKLVTT